MEEQSKYVLPTAQAGGSRTQLRLKQEKEKKKLKHHIDTAPSTEKKHQEYGISFLMIVNAYAY